MKLLKNRRKLNNKGFTLIELLAVVVILAIVMGISATSVLNSINNSRSSSLYSAAQNAANTLNTWVTEDAVVADQSKRMLGTTFEENTQSTGENGKIDTWICLEDENIENITNRGKSTTLLNALGISESDIVTASDSATIPSATEDNEGNITGYTVTKDETCSAIRYNSTIGAYELFLNAKSGGKYFVTTQSDNYAFSRATAVNTTIKD